MNLVLEREKSNAQCTIGALYVNGFFECWTLEDVVRDEKIAGETAIPPGTYAIIVTYSPHFDRGLPLLLGVPNFQGVRIHSGNTAADTEGCILVGLQRGENEVLESRKAFEQLFPKIQDALANKETVTIRIEPHQEPTT